MINLFFVVTGYDHSTPFIAKFTFSELQQNKGKHANTEMFYTLQELTEDDFDYILSNKMMPINVGISRDDENSRAIIMRVPEYIFNNIKEQ